MRDLDSVDCFGNRLLAGTGVTWHADLRHARHRVSRIPGFRRRMRRAAVVAGSCRPCDPDDSSRPRVVPITKTRLINRTDQEI